MPAQAGIQGEERRRWETETEKKRGGAVSISVLLFWIPALAGMTNPYNTRQKPAPESSLSHFSVSSPPFSPFFSSHPRYNSEP
jgi:hypothetical protein